MSDLARIIAAQAREIEDLRRQARGRSREGRVVAIDEARGLARVDVGREGNVFLTGWIKTEALAAGGVQVQADPVVGQHVRVTSENGDLTDAVISLSSFDDSQPRPHGKAGELKVVIGDTSITGTTSSLTLASNGAAITIDAGGVHMTGALVDHGGTNIGKTHVHKGVQSGTSDTGVPK